MLFNYSELGPTRFEKLIIEICADLLGEGIQSFSTGKDRGQDAIFEGKANKYPSEREPWEGKIIIQAKHTVEDNPSYSDNKFYSVNGKSSYFKKELIKVKGYIDDKKIILTHYMLFSNRKLTSQTSDTLKKDISKYFSIEIKNIGIFGISDLDRHLANLPHIARKYKLLKDITKPLDFDSDDLVAVICSMHKVFVKSDVIKEIKIPDFFKISFKEKAPKNNIPSDYAKTLEDLYMQHVGFIKNFLSHPLNEEIKNQYEENLHELKPKVSSYQAEGCSFNKIFEEIYDIVKNNGDIQSLSGKRKELVRAVLFYMFLNCDIGKK